jgi:hypothetical protein
MEQIIEDSAKSGIENDLQVEMQNCITNILWIAWIEISLSVLLLF